MKKLKFYFSNDKSFKTDEGILLQSGVGKGKNYLRIKLKEMFGVEATGEQVVELEKIVLSNRGFHMINFNEVKSLRVNPKTGEIKEAE